VVKGKEKRARRVISVAGLRETPLLSGREKKKGKGGVT